MMTAATPPVESTAVEERRAVPASHNTKPSSQTVTLRLPDPMLEEIKHLARQRDVSFQTMVRALLAEQLEQRSENP